MEEGGRAQTEEEDASGSEEGALQVSHGSGACKWFNVRMGFGFLSMTTRDGTPLDEPVDVFVHQPLNPTWLGAPRPTQHKALWIAVGKP
ncbi:unnamed protein product [Arctogadus glacialis]